MFDFVKEKFTKFCLTFEIKISTVKGALQSLQMFRIYDGLSVYIAVKRRIPPLLLYAVSSIS